MVTRHPLRSYDQITVGSPGRSYHLMLPQTPGSHALAPMILMIAMGFMAAVFGPLHSIQRIIAVTLTGSAIRKETFKIGSGCPRQGKRPRSAKGKA